MLALLQFVFSSFWTFAGTFLILTIVGDVICKVAYQCRMAMREFASDALRTQQAAGDEKTEAEHG